MAKDFDNIRTYNIDGAVYPSVTTVLGMMDKSGPLLNWAVKMAVDFVLNEEQTLYQSALATTPENDLFHRQLEHVAKLAKAAHRTKSQKALDIGSRVHELVHQLGLGNPINLEAEEDRVQNGVNAYKKWVDERHYIGIEHEMVVYSKSLRVAGTMDELGVMDGKLTLLDWKTSKSLYDEYLIQVAIYAHCYEEMTGKTVEDAWIVRFDKETGLPEERQVTHRDEHVECFKGLRAAFQWKQDQKIRNQETK